MVNVVKAIVTKTGDVTITAPFIRGLKEDEAVIFALYKIGNKNPIGVSLRLASEYKLGEHTWDKLDTIKFAFDEMKSAIITKLTEDHILSKADKEIIEIGRKD